MSVTIPVRQRRGNPPQKSDAPVCPQEAKYALMRAALRTVTAREQKDTEALVFWRGYADVAREWLREAE